jgi:hypothetical protein
MGISIVKVAPALRDEWDEVWKLCDYATYFHSSEWASIWSVYTNGEFVPAPRMILFSDGKKAVVPLSLQKGFKGWPKTFWSSPAGTFGGWISKDSLTMDHTMLLVSYVRKLSDLCWRMNPYDELLSNVVVEGSRTDVTDVLDLKDGFEAIYQGWPKWHRKAANQARRKGVVIRLANSLGDWKEYYEVYKDSLRRWGDTATSRYEFSLFEEMERRNSPNIKLWLATYQEKIIAGALCLYAKKHVAGWHAASLEEYFRLRPNNVIQYEAIRDACERGFSWYDFNPSGGHEGVRSFKKSFGTQAYPSNVLIQHLQHSLVFRPMNILMKGFGFMKNRLGFFN